MLLLRLQLRNAFCHKLRTGLTMLGFVVAVVAFGLLRTVLLALQAVSGIVIVLAVMANTMAMTARERVPEYATLKAIGFSPRFVAAWPASRVQVASGLRRIA